MDMDEKLKFRRGAFFGFILWCNEFPLRERAGVGKGVWLVLERVNEGAASAALSASSDRSCEFLGGDIPMVLARGKGRRMGDNDTWFPPRLLVRLAGRRERRWT